MSPEPIARLERELAQRFGRGAAVALGSGTAALYCAFEWLRRQGDAPDPAVIFPETTCETAVNAAVFAGWVPRFCDVHSESALMDVSSARQAVRQHAARAVVPTHIYGHQVDMDALRVQTGSSVALIEDAAQSYGGEPLSKGATASGGMSVISFGPGKLLDCGAGGALLCDDLAQAEACRRIAARLPVDDSGAAPRRALVMAQMLAARKIHRADRAALLGRQWQVLTEHRDAYLNQCTPESAQRILAALSQIESAVRARRTLTRQLDELFSERPGLRLPRRNGREVLWRYSFFVDDDRARDDWARRMSRAGASVSKLFAPCSLKFSVSAVAAPGAALVASTVINIQYPAAHEGHEELLRAIEKELN